MNAPLRRTSNDGAVSLSPGRMDLESPVCFAVVMQRVTINDFEDERLDIYRNLKDSTLAISRGRFIVEGRGNLLVMLSHSAHRPESILLSERTSASIEAELAPLVEPGCPVYVAGQSILDRVVGFPIHRGCLAAALRPSAVNALEIAREALEREAAPRLVLLEGLTNLDNVGLIFRNAMALGGRAILLCPRSCDPLYRKAIRTSMGGTLCVPFARADDFEKLLAGLKELGFQILAFDPGEESVEIREFASSRPGPIALLFGTEGPGLSDEALAQADQRIRIAMEPGVDSLNVGVAAGIGLSLLRAD